MNFNEKKAYVDKFISILPDDEKNFFDYNFACVFTKNSVGMESGINNHLEEVVASIKGLANNVDEDRKRALYNHYKAYNEVLDIIKANPNEKLSEELIKNVHEQVVDGINGSLPGGIYRNANIEVKGSKYVPCDYIKVYPKMEKYINEVNDMPAGLDKAIEAHLRLHKIHPFFDGNGRTSRIIFNFMLIQNGFVPISIPTKRRNEYFNALEEYKINKTSEPFKALVMDLLEKEYDRLIDLILPYENK